MAKGVAEVEKTPETEAEAEEVFDESDVQNLKDELLREAGSEEERAQLTEIFDVADEESDKIQSMDEIFTDLLTVDEDEADPNEAKEAIVEVLSVLYKEGMQDRDQLLDLNA